MIDSHAHIDFPAFDGDREEVLARARQRGVEAIVTVGIDLPSSRFSLQIAQQHPEVFTAVGFHPHQASELGEGDLRQLAELANEAKVVAIGEIGLDFYRRLSPRQRQVEAFQQQLDLAAELGLPVIIHCRQAHKEVLDILSRWVAHISTTASNSRQLGVIHCFSGDTRLAERYIEMGFVISLPGSVTYPSAREKVAVAREVPLNKLLVETDSPFLAPQLYRGKRNEPSYIPLIVDKIAQVREVSTEVVARATAENTVGLFHLSCG